MSISISGSNHKRNPLNKVVPCDTTTSVGYQSHEQIVAGLLRTKPSVQMIDSKIQYLSEIFLMYPTSI